MTDKVQCHCSARDANASHLKRLPAQFSFSHCITEWMGSERRRGFASRSKVDGFKVGFIQNGFEMGLYSTWF